AGGGPADRAPGRHAALRLRARRPRPQGRAPQGARRPPPRRRRARARGRGAARARRGDRARAHGAAHDRGAGRSPGGAPGRPAAVLRALPRLEAVLAGLAAQYRFRLDTPFKDLPATVRAVLLEGSGEQEVEFAHGGRTVRRPFAGLLALCRRRQQETRSAWLREELEGLVSDRRCTACEGTRLRREARFVRVGGRSIVEVSALPIGDALGFFRDLALSPT